MNDHWADTLRDQLKQRAKGDDQKAPPEHLARVFTLAEGYQRGPQPKEKNMPTNKAGTLDTVNDLICALDEADRQVDYLCGQLIDDSRLCDAADEIGDALVSFHKRAKWIEAELRA
ncbi:hypothetical protein ACAG25_19465 [Mycobacterium sp. pV006]|uniref:hypothetical protein n=1 Tax=Mycobacterium sp. pV006 TaxID=3238983 RepID=UPI00351B868E